jgi:hypothetical protein
VQIGDDLPSSTITPDSINAPCALMPGQLSTVAGDTVRVACTSPVTGRVVTVQIRSGCPTFAAYAAMFPGNSLECCRAFSLDI